MQNEKIRNYEVSVSVCVTAHSADEARALVYDLLLSRGEDSATVSAAQQTTSEARLDFEDEEKANLDDAFFEEGEC